MVVTLFFPLQKRFIGYKVVKQSEKTSCVKRSEKKDLRDGVFGSAFTPEELELLHPQDTESRWKVKQAQIVQAAHRKCEERNEIRNERDELLKKVAKLEAENAQLKAQKPGSAWQSESPSNTKDSNKVVLDQLRAEITTLRAELDTKKSIDIRLSKTEGGARKGGGAARGAQRQSGAISLSPLFLPLISPLLPSPPSTFPPPFCCSSSLLVLTHG